MKTTNIFNRILLGSALFASLVVASCNKDDDDNNNTGVYSISGNASGTQENPANAETGTATLSGTYNSNTNKLDYTINWTGLTGSATVAHFHGPAAVGVNADPLVDITITTNGVYGAATGSVTLADSTETHLLNGNVYYNVHTLAHPDGEIRAQVITTAN